MRKLTHYRFYLIAGVFTIAAIAVLMLLQNRKKNQKATGPVLPFSPILNPLTIRVDRGGDGHFNTSRIGHVHEGTDFVCRPGQGIYAPFAGTITRKAYPYATDLKWEGLLLEDLAGEYACKLFYCKLAVPVGTAVGKGQLIAFAQSISAKYTSGVTDHVHCEIRQNGTLINPETVFTIL